MFRTSTLTFALLAALSLSLAACDASEPLEAPGSLTTVDGTAAANATGFIDGPSLVGVGCKVAYDFVSSGAYDPHAWWSITGEDDDPANVADIVRQDQSEATVKTFSVGSFVLNHFANGEEYTKNVQVTVWLPPCS